MILAYFGPETMMPMASVLAAVTGVFLMLGRQAFAFLRLGLRKLGRMVGLVKTPEPVRVSKAPGRRLDQAETAIHGVHAGEVVSPKGSELDQTP